MKDEVFPLKKASFTLHIVPASHIWFSLDVCCYQLVRRKICTKKEVGRIRTKDKRGQARLKLFYLSGCSAVVLWLWHPRICIKVYSMVDRKEHQQQRKKVMRNRLCMEVHRKIHVWIFRKLDLLRMVSCSVALSDVDTLGFLVILCKGMLPDFAYRACYCIILHVMPILATFLILAPISAKFWAWR